VRGDDGAAIVEFAMVTVLLVLVLFAVIQVAALLYVRSAAAAAAADGARHGAEAGVDPAAGGERAATLIAQSLGTGMARRLPCAGSADTDPGSGLRTARVECRGDITSVLLPIGVFVHVDAVAESLKEGS
jgi:Flp pilus assembly protein TadG